MVSAYTLLAELDSRLQCRRAKILWFCGVYFSSTFLSSCSPLQQRMSSRLCTWPPTLEQLRVFTFGCCFSIAAVLESILVCSLVFVFQSPVAILTISQPSAPPMVLSLS
ncbi:hypothetical protein B0H14DRAFT_2754653, partial [Mycena olivaceomarginata]